MIRFGLLAIGLLVLAPVLPAPALHAEDDPAFTLGVLRRDGIVIPFAAFDGKSWSSPWPGDLQWLELPVSLRDVPERWFGKAGTPEHLIVWSGGVKGATIDVSNPVTFPVSCARRLGLRTTFRATEENPRPAVQPYPKSGLAVSAGATIEPIEILNSSSEDWKRLGQALYEPFAVAEDVAVKRIPDWKHPIKPEFRRRVNPEIEALYRAPMDIEGWTAYYIEAIKRFPPGPDDKGCGLVTSVAGSILVGPGLKREFRLHAVVSYCDRRDVLYFLPLGRVTVKGRISWIYKQAGYGAEHYIVARPTRSVVEVSARFTAAACRF